MTRKDLRRVKSAVLRQAKKDLRQLHQSIERKTGLLFGCLHIPDGYYSPSGYPLNRFWLTIAPRRDGYAFAVTVRSRGVYLDRVPKHEEVSA